MSKQVKRHTNCLSLIATSEDSQKVALMKTMTIEQFKILIECIYNVLYGVISINPKTKKKLMKYKKVIRELADKHTTRIRRRKLLLKYRFLLPILIKAVLEEIQNDERDDTDTETEI